MGGKLCFLSVSVPESSVMGSSSVHPVPFSARLHHVSLVITANGWAKSMRLNRLLLICLVSALSSTIASFRGHIFDRISLVAWDF